MARYKAQKCELVDCVYCGENVVESFVKGTNEAINQWWDKVKDLPEPIQSQKPLTRRSLYGILERGWKMKRKGAQ